MTYRWSAILGFIQFCALSGANALAGQAAAPSAVPAFVPMPPEIQCRLDGVTRRPTDETSGRLVRIDGTMGSLRCWIGAKFIDLPVEIPLASSEIENGMLATRDFGKFKIVGVIDENGKAKLAIHRERLSGFRSFLQKRAAEIIATNRHLDELSSHAWALIQDFNVNPTDLSDTLSALAKAGLLEKPNAEGMTLLNRAAQLGQAIACEQLVQLGANPNAADAQGRTALYFIASKSPSLYDLFVAKGGSENKADVGGTTPAEIAGRFVSWKNLQEPLDDDGVKALLKPNGPFVSMRGRIRGDVLISAKDIFPVAGSAVATTKINVAAIGSGRLQVSSETGVESISGSARCFMSCLLLPFGSEVELGTSAYLWGRLFSPGRLSLQQDGVRFEPSTTTRATEVGDRPTGNVSAHGTIDAGTNFSSGSSFTFASPGTATSVDINPPAGSLHGGESLQFHATSTSMEQDKIIWTIEPQLGRITADGLYEAPSAVERTGQVTVMATSTLDPRKQARATVVLSPK